MSSKHIISNTIGWLLVASQLLVDRTNSFSPQIAHPGRSFSRTSSTLSSTQVNEGTDIETDAVVRSPMRFLGPYPTMPLKFPNLSTASQRERNITGISLDWVLDTAANVNTINAQVAMELGLEVVGEAPGGVGAAGGIMGGDTFMLGDCELDIPKNIEMSGEDGDANEKIQEIDNDEFIFMKELTASALPVASPAAAGLLGLAFFYCFEGGVEFNWQGNGNDEPPSVTFYGTDKGLDVSDMTRVPFESLPVSMLPSVTININGKEIPALFDTGSPITVLNAKAAEEAGIATSIPMDEVDPEKQSREKGGWNPFSKLAANIESAKQIADATAKGDILTIAGSDGKPARLVRSMNQEIVKIKSSSGEDTDLGTSTLFVGDIPGLAALGGLGGDAPPAAILGMDFLRLRPKVVFRARQNEIYL